MFQLAFTVVVTWVSTPAFEFISPQMVRDTVLIWAISRENLSSSIATGLEISYIYIQAESWNFGFNKNKE